MKKMILSVLAVAMLTAFSAGTALAQEIIIGNGCDFPLHGLALVKSGQSEGDNLISEPLASGDGIKVNLNVNKGIDLMAVDNEGTTITFENLDLSGASKVILHKDGTASIE